MVWLPVNVNICSPVVPPVEDERNRLHGTATCFLPVGVKPPVPVVVPPGEVAPPALELNSTIAKSTLPDCGLMMTSLILPILLPWEVLMLAPIRSLPLISFLLCEEELLPLVLREPEEEEPPWEPELGVVLLLLLPEP